MLTPTLLAYHDDRPALGGWEQDFEADVLWREGYPRFGARPAPLSHVGDGPQPLPAGASPQLPTLGGRLRDEGLEDGAKRPATLLSELIKGCYATLLITSAVC